MIPATSLRLRTLRPVLLGALAPPSSRRVPSSSYRACRWILSRPASTASLQPGTGAGATKNLAAKHPVVAAFLIPEFRTSAITEITADELFKKSTLSAAPAPDEPLEKQLLKLYTRNPPAFLHAGLDFYKLKKNTRIPEVCILGRSNVGKSSFINALAGRRSNGLANVSSKAGRTRSINTYGFGPAPTVQKLQGQGSRYRDEDKPTHTFHLVDMPGYGHASLEEWGKNISLYLNKRSALKGAIALIDAKVGPKETDIHLFRLLNAAQLKTAIVLTKADKVKKGLEGMRETCTQIWDAIHTIELENTDRSWAWERDVYVTAAGADNSGVAESTITTARLAVARLAGLVKDERDNAEKNKRWSGKVISFDDLQYPPGSRDVVPEASVKTSGSTDSSAPMTQSSPAGPKYALADLDRAAKAQYSGQARNGISWGPKSQTGSGRMQASAFFSTSERRVREDNRFLKKRDGGPQSPRFQSKQEVGSPQPTELRNILDDFLESLRTDKPRDQVRRISQSRKIQPPKKFPEQTARAQAIYVERTRFQAVARGAAKPSEEPFWPEATTSNRPSKGASKVMEADDFERAFTSFGEGSEPTATTTKKKKKKKRKGKARQDEDADEFEPSGDSFWPVAAPARTKNKKASEVMDASAFEQAFSSSGGLGDKRK
ncbi:hypothetical protein F4777DRAFT_114680 [Nemania sp. FL0916]|nr:hypothetical protein F4777DRAFT_114680 [Nemania sp. FL0916]